MRILVTGGAGFIGSAFCRLAVSGHDDDILNVDKLTYAGNLASLRPIEQSPSYHFAQNDICDLPAIVALIGDFQPDAIVHLAAESHVDRSITGARAFLDTNVNGTFAMLEAARGYWDSLPASRRAVFRFLHVSTDEVYGSLGETGLFNETTPYDPSSPYSATKAAADHLAIAWHRTYGLPVVVTNCSNNFGPYQFPEKLIPLIILNALDGKPLPVYGDGRQVRDWLHVEDHAGALRHILLNGKPGEKYNIGGKAERRNIDVVETICALLDRMNPTGKPHASLIRFVTDRPGHDRRYAIDTGKIERDLGWRPARDFDDGIAATIRWYLDNEWWWRPLRKTVYSGERLGLESKIATRRSGGE